MKEKEILKELNLNENELKENIAVIAIVYRSSDGYYNYKYVAIVVMHPAEDKNDVMEADSRSVMVREVVTGAFQRIQHPREALKALEELAKELGLNISIVKLDWYYHFIGS